MSAITEAKKKNNEEFTRLIEENKLAMYKTAKAILKNEEDVCDALQEALISMYKNINSLKNEKYFKTWAIRIVINKCYDLIYQQKVNDKKITQVKEHTIENQDYLDNNLYKSEVKKALEVLDKDLKLITVLYYYDELSVKKISSILKIPVGTVKSRLSRAREKLYNILEKQEGGGHR